jgi:hypothetical protein
MTKLWLYHKMVKTYKNWIGKACANSEVGHVPLDVRND